MKTNGELLSSDLAAYDYVVEDEAGRLALTGMTVGDTIFVKDSSLSYIADSDITSISTATDLSVYATESYVDNSQTNMGTYDYVVADIVAKDALTGMTDGNTIFVKSDASVWTASGGTGLGTDAIIPTGQSLHTITTTGSFNANNSSGFTGVITGTVTVDTGVDWNTVMLRFSVYSVESYNNYGSIAKGVGVFQDSTSGVKGYSNSYYFSQTITGQFNLINNIPTEYKYLQFHGGIISGVEGSDGLARITRIYKDGTQVKLDYLFKYFSNTASGRIHASISQVTVIN